MGPRFGDQGGFTLIELLVVMIVVAIVGTTGVWSMRSFVQTRHDTAYAAAAERIWGGISEYRLDDHGRFPLNGYVTPGADPAQLADDNGDRYVEQWPEDPEAGGPVRLQVHNAVSPPDRIAGGGVYYHVDAARLRGWLAAYSKDGSKVYARGVAPRAGTNVLPVSADATTVVPVG